MGSRSSYVSEITLLTKSQHQITAKAPLDFVIVSRPPEAL